MPNDLRLRQTFADRLLALAKHDRDIVVCTSDSRGSSCLTDFGKQLPEQLIETGIAEQNLVGIAAGLASFGKKVFVCAPASFLSMRSAEQIKVDIAYNEANVKLIAVSAGVSYGALGPTHHALGDIALMRTIPNLAVLAPSDSYQMQRLTDELLHLDGPAYVRIGRNSVPPVYDRLGLEPFVFGKAVEVCQGNHLTMISCGEVLHRCVAAAQQLRSQGIHTRVLDMPTIKPLDEEAVLRAGAETKAVLTVEEHSIYGGLGSAVAETLSRKRLGPVTILGIPDEPAVAGSQQEIWNHYGLSVDNITTIARRLLS